MGKLTLAPADIHKRWAAMEARVVAAERAMAAMMEVAGKADAEIERLRKIETAARALKFAAYPAHGSGFITQVTGGNINDLEAALSGTR